MQLFIPIWSIRLVEYQKCDFEKYNLSKPGGNWIYKLLYFSQSPKEMYLFYSIWNTFNVIAAHLIEYWKEIDKVLKVVLWKLQWKSQYTVMFCFQSKEENSNPNLLVCLRLLGFLKGFDQFSILVINIWYVLKTLLKIWLIWK